LTIPHMTSPVVITPVIMPKIGTSPGIIGTSSRELPRGTALGQKAFREIETLLSLAQLLPERGDLVAEIFELKLALSIGSAANPLRKGLSDLAPRNEHRGDGDEKGHRNQCVGNRHLVSRAPEFGPVEI